MTIRVKLQRDLPWLTGKIEKCTTKERQKYADIFNLLITLNGEPEFRKFYIFVTEYCNVYKLTDTVKKRECFFNMVLENWIKQNDVSIL